MRSRFSSANVAADQESAILLSPNIVAASPNIQAQRSTLQKGPSASSHYPLIAKG